MKTADVWGLYFCFLLFQKKTKKTKPLALCHLHWCFSISGNISHRQGDFVTTMLPCLTVQVPLVIYPHRPYPVDKCSCVPPVCLCEAPHLSLRNDVEGAAFLALPDDVFSFIIVLLVRQGGERGRRRAVSQNWSITLIRPSTRMVWFLVASPLRDEGESLVINNAP